MTNEIIRVVGRGIPKLVDNQTTDDILPARFMKRPSFDTMGDCVYYDERFPGGKKDPSHPFNDPKYLGGSILISGASYGNGSSREHAPQGLYRFGIRGIIAESYADIFDGNCATIGIVAVKAHREDIASLVLEVEQNPDMEIRIDLLLKSIDYIGSSSRQVLLCDIPEGTRQALMRGTWEVLPLLQENSDKAEEVRLRLPYLALR